MNTVIDSIICFFRLSGLTVFSLLQWFLFFTLSIFLLVLSITLIVYCIKTIICDNSRWYIPRIDITVSTDGGKSYHNHLAAIPCNGVFYLYFNISIRLISRLLFWKEKQLFCHLSAQHIEGFDISLHECSNLYQQEQLTNDILPFSCVFLVDPYNKNRKQVGIIFRCQIDITQITVFPIFTISIKKKQTDCKSLFKKVICPSFIDSYGNPIRKALTARPRCFCDDKENKN